MGANGANAADRLACTYAGDRDGAGRSATAPSPTRASRADADKSARHGIAKMDGRSSSASNRSSFLESSIRSADPLNRPPNCATWIRISAPKNDFE